MHLRTSLGVDLAPKYVSVIMLVRLHKLVVGIVEFRRWQLVVPLVGLVIILAVVEVVSGEVVLLILSPDVRDEL